jgi:hypothetical protein
MLLTYDRVTIGGVNGPICHGAGARHSTVNDYVRKVEYVDANGTHRTISNPEHLKAAAGCFGLLGIVTHITFELDPMAYAVLEPRKIPVEEAIPPQTKEQIPPALRTDGYEKIPVMFWMAGKQTSRKGPAMIITPNGFGSPIRIGFGLIAGT